MNIYHLSDLHWGAGYAQKVGFELAVNYLIQINDVSGVIVVSGDVVEGVNKGEWVPARAHLMRLREVYLDRLLIVPGNHDCSDWKGITYCNNAASRTKFYLNTICPNFKPSSNGLRVTTNQGVKFIGVDTCIGNSDDRIPPLARGEIGTSQLAGLELELQDEVPTFIIMHHKPFSTNVTLLLEDRAEFLKLVRRRHHVKAVFFGHIHLSSVQDFGGVRYFESDNTTISRRVRVVDSESLEHFHITF